MNRSIKALALLLILPSLAIAQSPPYIRNDAGATINGADLGTASARVDGKGNLSTTAVDPSTGEKQSVIPVSNASDLNGGPAAAIGYQFTASDLVEAGSTSTVLNATAHSARVGDIVSFRSGTAANVGAWSPISAVAANTITLSNALPATAATNDAFYILRPEPMQVNANVGGASVNSLNVAISTDGQPANNTGLLKLEDSAAASGDALVGVAGVINPALTAPGATGDYSTFSMGTFGNGLNTIVHDTNLSAAASVSAIEDSAAMGTGAAGLKTFIQLQDPLTVDAATGDAGFAKADLAGRTITTLAPAGESFQSCGTATATTADVPMQGNIASNRNYVTAITCKNTSATVATSLDFKAGTTVVAVGGISQMAAGAAGSFTATFPVPLRTSVNQAFQFATNVATSSVTCCASGYISVN